MNKSQIIVFSEKSLSFTPFDVKWMPKSAKVIVIGSNPRGTGALQIFELNDGKLEQIQETEFPNSLKCGTFAASSLEERHIAIGSFSGNLSIVDLSNPRIPVYSVKAHSSIINCIDGIGGLNIGKGSAEIVTGSSDGTVKIWDPRCKDKPVVTVEPEDCSGKRDCWSVAFGNAHSASERMVCAGFDNGDIKLFDLRTVRIMWETTLSNGICDIQFDRKDISMNKLLVTTLESTFSIFELKTLNEKSGFSSLTTNAHNSTVWCGKHLPQNRDIFLTSGGNGSLNLWKYYYPSVRSKKLEDGSVEGITGNVELLQDITVTSQPITSLDWSPDKKGLCSSVSIDQILRLLIVTKLNTV